MIEYWHFRHFIDLGYCHIFTSGVTFSIFLQVSLSLLLEVLNTMSNSIRVQGGFLKI